MGVFEQIIDGHKLIISDEAKYILRPIAKSKNFNAKLIDEIVLPVKVRFLCDYAIANFPKLSKITLPNEINNIPVGCFSGSGITEIDIPESVHIIDVEAFQSCKNLKKVKIPKSVTEIGDSCFQGCVNLEEINFPETEYTIGASAFCHCKNLHQITINPNCQDLGYGAFYDCVIDSLHITNKTELYESTIYNCEIKEINVDVDGTVHKTSLKKDETLICNKAGLFIIDRAREIVTGYLQSGKYQMYYVELLELNNYMGINASMDIPELFLLKKYMKQNGEDEQVINTKLLNNLIQIYGESAPEYYFNSIKHWSKFDSKCQFDLFKIYNVLGMFAGDDRERARCIALFSEPEYMAPIVELNNLIETLEMEGEKVDLVFNPKIARFFFENRKTMLENDDFASFAYLIQNFDEVQNSCKNKSGSFKVITLEFLKNYIVTQAMANEQSDLSDFYKTVCKYYFDEDSIEELKELYFISSGVKYDIENGKYPDYFSGLKSETAVGKYTFEFLDRADPNYLVLGNICDCCARIGGAGQSILQDTCEDYNKIFIVIRDAGRIVAKSSCIYDEKEKIIVLNNVEINENYKNVSMSEQDQMDMLKCLSDATYQAMLKIKAVTHCSDNIDAIIGNNATNDLFLAVDENLPVMKLNGKHIKGYSDYDGDFNLWANALIVNGEQVLGTNVDDDVDEENC